jgi:hypothetical protein
MSFLKLYMSTATERRFKFWLFRSLENNSLFLLEQRLEEPTAFVLDFSAAVTSPSSHGLNIFSPNTIPEA